MNKLVTPWFVDGLATLVDGLRRRLRLTVGVGGQGPDMDPGLPRGGRPCGGRSGAGFLLGVSLAFGLTLLTMVYTIGPISGCHINPAVSLGLWVGNMSFRQRNWFLTSSPRS